MNVLLLMLGGSGQRFGAKIPKQFTLFNNKPVFLPILEHYERSGFIDLFCLVVHKDWLDNVRRWTSNIKTPVMLVQGGLTRSHSIRNGLVALESQCKAEDVILIHDSTHPYLDILGVKKVIDAVHTHGGATLATFGYDTVYSLSESDFINKVLPRTKVVNGASPEAFKFGLVHSLYSQSSNEELSKMTSAAAIFKEHGIDVKFIPTEILNLKITFQRDFQLYTKLGEEYFYPECEC